MDVREFPSKEAFDLKNSLVPGVDHVQLVLLDRHAMRPAEPDRWIPSPASQDGIHDTPSGVEFPNGSIAIIRDEDIVIWPNTQMFGRMKLGLRGGSILVAWLTSAGNGINPAIRSNNSEGVPPPFQNVDLIP